MSGGPSPGRRHVWRVVFAVVCATSMVILFAPGDATPTGLTVSDEAVHATLFALLGVTGLGAGVPLRRLALSLLAYAGCSELLQAGVVPDRSGDPLDVLADVAGAALGLTLGLTRRPLSGVRNRSGISPRGAGRSGPRRPPSR